MSILVDTSVWSLMLRRKTTSDHPASLFLQAQIQNQSPLFLSGIICQEILQGISSFSQFKQLRRFLLDFPFLEATFSVHEKAAEIFNQSKARGFNASTVDCLITATAIHYRCPLLTTDSDFHHLSRYTTLQLSTF